MGLCADACAGVAVSGVGLGELAPLPWQALFFAIATAFGCSLIINDFIKTAFIARYWHGGVGSLAEETR